MQTYKTVRWVFSQISWQFKNLPHNPYFKGNKKNGSCLKNISNAKDNLHW